MNMNSTELSDTQINFYSLREEFWNALTHGFGGLAVLIGMIFLGWSAYGSGLKIFIPVLIYGCSLFALYMASTFYHAVSNARWKLFFRRMDYCAIYLLIAGTYTPLMLFAVGGPWGLGILIAVWCLAGIGITVKCLTMKECGGLSLYLYLIMGWLCVLCIRSLFLGLSTPGMSYLVAGGVFYSAGIFFFLSERPYFHSIWHLFVLLGTSCHFLMVGELF